MTSNINLLLVLFVSFFYCFGPVQAQQQKKGNNSTIGDTLKKRGIISAPDLVNKNNVFYPAQIKGDQTIKNGSLVEILLLRDLQLDNNLIAKGTTLIGKVHFTQDIVDIVVGSIVVKDQILETNLVAYFRGYRGLPSSEIKNNAIVLYSDSPLILKLL